MANPAQIQPPVAEPVTVAELKAHLRIEHDADDEQLEQYLLAAREQAEAKMQRTLVATTLEAYYSGFGGALVLRLPTVLGVLSVKYLDKLGDEQELPPEHYRLRARRLPNVIVPASGVVWPSTLCDPEAVVVRYRAGFGEDADAVPASIKQWIMLVAGQMYENREALTGSNLSALPRPFLDGLLDAHRVIEVV